MRLQERSGVRLDPRPVPLEPFGHQVAGQASMLTLDPRTVCKPLIPREHHLYCTLPPSLRPFTPHYQGVLYVRLEEGDDGSLNLWGYYPLAQDDAQEEDNEVIRRSVCKDDVRDNDRKVEHKTSAKEPSSKQEAANSDVVRGPVHKKREVNSEPSGKNHQTVETLQIKDPVRDPAGKCGVRGKSPEKNAEGCDSKPKEQDGGRGGKDTEHEEDVVRRSRRCEGRQELWGEEGHLLSVPSRSSSGTSTPVSSGSEQDMSSAFDCSPFPSRPSSGCVVRLTEDGEYEVTAGRSTDNKFVISGDDQALPVTTQDATPHKQVTTHPLNPWGLSLHTRLLDKMRKSEPSLSGYPFLVLENVVARFSRPCILDLKVGSRLFGDDASAKKRASQSRKCNMTTSRSLGLRLCGMQVYQKTTGAYNSLDKFYGRTLTDNTFCNVLHDFLHNGQELRQELLAPIVARLHALIDCLKELNSFRFYASSLLIMYDGLSSDSVQQHDNQGRTRVPDPENCGKNMHAAKTQEGKTVKGAHAPSSVCGQSRSAGGKTVEQVSSGCDKWTSDSCVDPVGVRPSTVSGQQRLSDRALQPATAAGSHSSKLSLGGDSNGSDHKPEETGVANRSIQRLSAASLSSIDVRMIDFAHTTHSGFNDNVTHEGPDEDYIWGLENLTRMFTQLLTDNSGN